MSSSYYQGKIDEFNGIISLISSVFDEFDECINVVDKLLEYKVDDLTIDDKPIVDDSSNGELMTMTDLSNELDSDKSLLNEIISECNDLVEKYTVLRDEALAREREAAQATGNSSGQESTG